MSFKTICESCGALTGPSIGVCPFCKRELGRSLGENPSLELLQHLYHEGRLDKACAVAAALAASCASSGKDLSLSFHLLHAKILLEAEVTAGPLIWALARAKLLDPTNPEVLDYCELVCAKQALERKLFDAGESVLKNLLSRSPHNMHALFTLGAYYLMGKRELDPARRYLEHCVHLHPNFLRAWGCLGVLYQRKGLKELAERAFLKCLGLESDPGMVEFFRAHLKALDQLPKKTAA